MPTVRLSFDECLNGRLPPVCAACGAPAGDGVRFLVPTRFLMYALGTASIMCPPMFVLVGALVVRKRGMQVPFCEVHRAEWLRWDRTLSWSYLAVVGGAFLAAVALLVLLPSDRVDSLLGPARMVGAKWVLIPTAYLVVALGWFVPMAVRQTRYVRTTQATGRDIRLSGVDPGFVRAVWEDRARDPARVALFGDARDDYDDER